MRRQHIALPTPPRAIFLLALAVASCAAPAARSPRHVDSPIVVVNPPSFEQQEDGEHSELASPPERVEPDGVQIDDEDLGRGEGAKVGDQLLVHYVGRLVDGTIFDSSRDRDQPFQFTLGRGVVIAGWEVGLLGMKPGGRRTITIPPHLAYGEQGKPGMIPPGSVLIFEIELLGVGPRRAGSDGTPP